MDRKLPLQPNNICKEDCYTADCWVLCGYAFSACYTKLMYFHAIFAWNNNVSSTRYPNCSSDYTLRTSHRPMNGRHLFLRHTTLISRYINQMLTSCLYLTSHLIERELLENCFAFAFYFIPLYNNIINEKNR